MTSKINLTSGAAISAYLLANGVIYLIGFWSIFKINALQYIDLKDVIKSVIMPLAAAIGIYILNTIITFYNVPDEKKTKDYLSAGGVFKGYIYLFRTIAFLGGMFLVGQVVYDLLFNNEAYRFRAFLVVISCIALWAAFFDEKFFSELGKLKQPILAAIILLPVATLNKGYIDAKLILEGSNTSLVTSDSSCVNDPDKKFRYISTLSDKVFAISLEDKSICIFKYNYLKITKDDTGIDLQKISEGVAIIPH